MFLSSKFRSSRGVWFAAAILLCSTSLFSQQQQQPSPVRQPGTPTPPQDQTPPPGESKRIFGIIPNYRTSPTLQNYLPLSAGEKFKVARQDALDPGTFVLAALFGGEGQLTRANPAFGNGVGAFGKYFVTSYADFAIGDYMTEAVFPSVLHQDPRYFRKRTGTSWDRLRYSCGQIFWTHNDSGRAGFNYSEILGNSTAVALSQTYYSDTRTFPDAGLKLLTQLGVDMAANILKEFGPDIQRWGLHRHKH